MIEPVHNHLGGDGVDRLVAFINRRESLRRGKEAGDPWPWTTDQILQTYRFCNVHREDDAVTRWIASNIRDHYARDPFLFYLISMARLFNEPATIEFIMEASGQVFGSSRSVARARKPLHERQASGVRIFNPAYMITTAGKKQDKIDYIFDLLGRLWNRRERLYPTMGDTLNSFHMALGMFDGLGSFLSGQVVADMRYAEPLRSASDWQTFACSGPGSRRGLNRVMGRPVKATWHEDEWRHYAGKLQVYVNTALRRSKIELHGQDLNNTLCEMDKYERARLGEGKPKQLYRRKDA